MLEMGDPMGDFIMDASRNGDVPNRIPQGGDDEQFFKNIITIDYDINETKECFAKNDAQILRKPPKHSLLYQLRVSDKLTYVTIGKSELILGKRQLVVCRNIAACRMCEDLFAYSNNNDILNYYRTHNCQQQSGVKEINTFAQSQNINKNLPSLQNNTDFPVCSRSQYEPRRINVENGSILQGVNKSDSGIRYTSMHKPPGNIRENLCSLQSINKSGLSACTIKSCEPCRIIGGKIYDLQKVNKSGSGDICSTNMYEKCGNNYENLCSSQNVNEKAVGSSINACDSSVHMDVNSTDMGDGNRSICNVIQEDDTEMDVQNCEKSGEFGAAVAEELLSSTDSVIIIDENAELNTTVNLTDESAEDIAEIPVPELNNEVYITENTDNNVIIENNVAETEKHRAMLDICDRLTNPVESTIVTDLYNYNLIVTMNEFYKTGRFTDVTVVCENQKVECHRLVLSMFSAHFEEMFRECCADRSAVAVEGLKFWQLKALIDYMYTSKISVDESEWCSLMEAVDRLQFRDYLRPKKLPRDIANKRVCTTNN